MRRNPMVRKASKIVFDIETLAYPFEQFDDHQQDYLVKFAKTEEEKAEAIERLSLGSLTARVITIAMINPDSGHGQVFYDHPGGEPWTSDDGVVDYIPGTEQEILERFWGAIEKFSLFITFNGRSFDCPFIMMRSMIHGVKATRNLLPQRYSASPHCDLLDQLTFYGATRKYNLDFFCKSLGIHSPKEDGITGLDLKDLHASGKHKEIAEYCLGDVMATAELYRRWSETIGGG
jgi:DNA polymerase elongation subunit (family B)